MMKIEEFKIEISTLIRAKYTLVAIESSEEVRAQKLVEEAAFDRANAQYVNIWSMTSGMRDSITNKSVEVIPTPHVHDPFQALVDIEKFQVPPGAKSVYILLDFHKFMDAPQIQRKLRDLSASLKYTSKTIVFISPSFKIPLDLQKSITVLELPLPDDSELKSILCEALDGLRTQEQTIKGKAKDNPEKEQEYKDQLTRVIKNRATMRSQFDAYGDRIIGAARGLTCMEFEDVLAKCFVGGEFDINMILSEKKQIIKKSGVLEYIDTTESAASIGGLKVLKTHITSVSRRLSKKARDFGILPQKGALLIGVPGGGKSLSAQACSKEMQLPIVRLDVGSLFGSLVGESESRTRQALKLADAIAPCILWIDEIEKGMSFGTGNGDSGVGQRIFGTLLTWMEENQGVYVIATCNSQKSLKPELMARFARIFFVDVPTAKELYEIILIHLVKVGRDPKNFDMDKIVIAAKGFVGREVRNVIQEALGAAFDEGIDLTTEHVIAQFNSAKPITIKKAEEIKEMREWADTNATNASEDDGKKSAQIAASTGKTGGRFESGIGLDDMV